MSTCQARRSRSLARAARTRSSARSSTSVPGAGSWRTALLLDGNIGIGGEPVRLLERVALAAGPGGELLVELDPPGTRTGPLRARLETPAASSAWFAWARVAFADIDEVAGSAGLAVSGRWAAGERWFARLQVGLS